MKDDSVLESSQDDDRVPWHRAYPVPEPARTQLRELRARWQSAEGKEADALEAEIAQFVAQLFRKRHPEDQIVEAFGGLDFWVRRWRMTTEAVPESQFPYEVPYSQRFPPAEQLADDEVEALQRLAPKAYKRGVRSQDKDIAKAAYRRLLVAALLRQVRPQTMATQLGEGFTETMVVGHANEAWKEYIAEGAPEGWPVPVEVTVDGVRPTLEPRSRRRYAGPIPLEANNTEGTQYERSAATVKVSAIEAGLVREFTSTLPEGSFGSLVVAAGYTSGRADIHLPGHEEIIEAKSSKSHAHIRQALAQLLDYAAHTDQPIKRLAALFPEEPADVDIALLNRYGIDVLYRESPGQFTRQPAPEHNRACILSLAAAMLTQP